jgi:regulator of nonsense transcripts 2
MKTQQAAEREEQQRIKNLVLNYDLRDGEEQDGDSQLAPLLPNPNIHKENAGLEKAAGLSHARPDKSGNNRSGQRARKLQLSDVDWYDSKPSLSHVEKFIPSPQKADATSAPMKEPVPGAILSFGLVGLASQQRVRRHVKATVQVGRLSRKEILQEHASRKAGATAGGKK